MKIERKKVEKVGEFSSRTKARLVALLGLSAALSVPAEPQGSDAVIPTPPTDSTNAITQDSTISLSSSSDSTDTQKVPENTNMRWLFDPDALAGIMEDSDEEISPENFVQNAIESAIERNVTR